MEALTPAVWLPLAPVDGQNANLYGREWADMLAGNVSSGIEPIFSIRYERKVLQADGSPEDIDVEKMDTTFKSPDSPHDVHRVACLDCHPKGVPKRKTER